MLIAVVFLLFGLPAAPATAADCSVTVESTDQMSYNTDEIVIDRSCDQFEITLEHVGSLSKEVMGHNIVFTRAGDLESLATDAMSASDSDYVPEGDERVVAATDLVGGGESTTLTIDPSSFEEGTDYRFFCSFPGHWSAMQGSVSFVN
jgi:azurin